jgi:hypothetical protein
VHFRRAIGREAKESSGCAGNWLYRVPTHESVPLKVRMIATRGGSRNFLLLHHAMKFSSSETSLPMLSYYTHIYSYSHLARPFP